MQPQYAAFNLDENRKLCLECLDTAIVDTNQAQPLYIEIQRFYEGLNMKLEQQIPLKLVGKQAIRKTREKYLHPSVRKTLHFSHP